MKFDNYINYVLNEDKLPGGLADGMTEEDLAKKHGVPIEKIKEQIKKGIKVEFEHTNDEDISREISFDHIYEIPDYYDRLEKMESDAKVKTEMVSADVVGTSGYESGVAPQDNIPYAKGDTRIPKSIFGSKKSKNGKKKTTMHIQRRNQIGM